MVKTQDYILWRSFLFNYYKENGMTPERRQIDTDLSDIKVSIGNIETLMKNLVEPAVEQVWKNEKCIASLKTKQKLQTWIGGSVFTAFLFWITKGHWYKH